MPRSQKALSGLNAAVYEYLATAHEPVTLAVLAKACGCSETTASARLRDLRKARFGSHRIGKSRDPERAGVWRYYLEPPPPARQRALFGEAAHD
jgi:hypothetical protein